MPPSAQPESVLTPAPEGEKSLGVSSVTLWGGVVLITVVAIGAWAYWSGALEGAPAQDAPKTIGMISISQVKEGDIAFKDEMARLGYADTVFLERLVISGPALGKDTEAAVREFVAADVDLIWVSLENMAKIAVDITSELGRTDVPIVFITRLHDPVEFGIIDSFQSSGNNSTGVATNLLEIIQRHLEFLKAINPNIKKLGMFGEGFVVPPVGGAFFAEVKKLAPRFGMEVVEFKTSLPPPQAKAEFERVAAGIKKGDIDAIIHIAGHYYETQEAGESRLAIRLGIPMVTNYEDIPRGGHFTYSDGTAGSGRQSAVIADKIFKGAKPADIPIEYSANNFLSLHLARARAAGVVFPDAMLFIAEKKYEDDSQFPSFEDH